MRRTALVDGDIDIYHAAVSNEQQIDWGDGDVAVTTDFDGARSQLQDRIDYYKTSLGADEVIFALSDPQRENWRKKLLPSYKANRGPKPTLLRELEGWAVTQFHTWSKPGLEADDVLGILATHPTLVPGRKCIVSIDKDLATIPGWLWNTNHGPKARKVSPEEANHWWMAQSLIGDSTDNYKGCPLIGPKKAEEILAKEVSDQGRWLAVLEAYWDAGLGYGDALVQAQVARICHHTDYDYQKQEALPWRP